MSSSPTIGRETTSPRTRTWPRAAKVGRWTLQGLFALILTATAVGKLLDVSGFVAVIDTYQLLPAALHWPAGVGLIAAEAVLAVWLVTGKKLVWAAGACTALHAGYATLAAVTLMRGIEIDNCGCFGVFLARRLSYVTVIEDSVLAVLSLVLLTLALSNRMKT